MEVPKFTYVAPNTSAEVLAAVERDVDTRNMTYAMAYERHGVKLVPAPESPSASATEEFVNVPPAGDRGIGYPNGLAPEHQRHEAWSGGQQMTNDEWFALGVAGMIERANQQQ